MNLSIKILETNKEIEKAICVALLPAVNKFMDNVQKYVQSNLFSIIKNAIINQPEHESLVNGKLRSELGIPDASIKIEEIISLWINNAIVQYQSPKIINNKIKSSLTIKVIKSNFSDVLGSDSAEVYDIAGYSIPWLQWLLLDGTETIIDNYEVYFGPNARSRTGYAIMKPSNNSWNVPPEFAGTIDNNWITRAITEAKPEIEKLLQRALS
jgi:hypothetical protein